MLISELSVLFFLLVGLVFYTYFGYPLVLFLLVMVKRLATPGSSPASNDSIGDWPWVTLVVAVHNEEFVLPDKLKNIEALDYRGRLEVMFVLDGTSDDSLKIIQSHCAARSRYPIKWFETRERVGKERALRGAILTLESDVLVFSDADSMYRSNVIEKLAAPLRDGRVGAACGHELHLSTSSADAGEGEGMFYRYENTVKRLLSQVSSLTYIQGGVFAMRRSDYPNVILTGHTQDGIIVFELVLKGKSVVFVDDAISTETYTLSSGQDFRRRVRTITRAFSSILQCWPVLLPWKTGWFGFHLISHRILRWWLIPMMAMLLLCNVLLALHSRLYIGLLSIQLGFYLVAFAGWRLERQSIRIKFFYIPYYFCYMHLAAALAIVNVLGGQQISVWTPTVRSKVK